MAKVTKRLAEVEVGDVHYAPKRVEKKSETKTHWVVTFDDGTEMTFEKKVDPAIDIGK